MKKCLYFLQKHDSKANKYNIKRSLQRFQGGQTLLGGKENVTVSAVLFFFSYSNSSKACAIVVKEFEEELLSDENKVIEKSSLELYKQIVKYQNSRIY